jgi:hypothetical protein
MGRTISDDIRRVPLVRASRTELGRLLAGGGLIARRCHPELIASMEWLVQRGELMSLLPGIYGDGDVRRQLYTDGGLAVFQFRRCIC